MAFFEYNYTMNLYALKYLFLLIFEGEKTSRELSEAARRSISNASHAMRMLSRLGLVKNPEKRVRSWVIDPTKKLNLLIEKLILISKNDADIKSLLQLSTAIKIGSRLNRTKGGQTISSLIESTGVSRMSAIKVLNRLVTINLLRKDFHKPNKYYIAPNMSAQLFFEACKRIEQTFTKDTKSEVTTKQFIRRLINDKSVLILVHYGSSSRGKGDRLSDIDLFAVTRDKISRGDILARYSYKGIDLSVYSKSGFLQLLKSQPDFISNISMARILKGRDILHAVTHGN